MNKLELLEQGVERMKTFCALNKLPIPTIDLRHRTQWPYGACAFYRPTYIAICLEACAHIGRAGRSWSYPGYSVDRTPFGVIQHELGHHADIVKSGLERGYMGTYSIAMRKEVGEEPLTSYCPNDAEWFAEMFRLFVTNPHLLRLIRPKTWHRLIKDWKPVELRPWQDVLKGAPERTLVACQRKVDGK